MMITDNMKKKIVGYRLIGLSYKEIGRLMLLSSHTVKKYSGERSVRDGGAGYVSKDFHRRLKKDYDVLRAEYKALQDVVSGLDNRLLGLKEILNKYAKEG